MGRTSILKSLLVPGLRGSRQLKLWNRKVKFFQRMKVFSCFFVMKNAAV
jgi:hypothetical protein